MTSGPAACMAGCRPAHGRAASSCDASRISVASSPNRPRKCTPIGRPSPFHYSGTDIAGLPVRLATTPAWRTVWALTSSDRHGSSGVEATVPIGSGGADIVGVRNAS